MAPADGVVIAVEGRRALHRMRWGVEDVEDSGLSSVKGRTVSEGRCPRPTRVLQRGKVHKVGGTVADGDRQVRTVRRRPAPRRE